MATNRLIGDYPVIGIRPTIDGRRGVLKVRESLEEQTMGMAKAAAKLFTENLKYSNGEPVKVVIADTTIGRVAEAAACAEKFKKEGVDGKMLYQALKDRGVLVRHFDKPNLTDYNRVTIGTQQEMDVLFECLEEIL